VGPRRDDGGNRYGLSANDEQCGDTFRHSIAVHLLEAGRGIEYVADHLGYRNIRNTRVYAQITNLLRDQVFRELEQHPKIVRVSDIASAVMPS
jgi:site-specific recombinase XerD